MSKTFYGVTALALFGLGVYGWRLARTGSSTRVMETETVVAPVSKVTSNVALVLVGKDEITSEDLEWEFKVHTTGIFDSDELTPIPDLGSRYEQQLDPLRKNLLAALIERKLLYRFIEKETDFDVSNPARYTMCLEEWQRLSERPKEDLEFEITDSERLKKRLCEKSIIGQYLKERVFPKAAVTDQMLEDYYQKNLREFKTPNKVIIRQVVTASENEAKKVRAKLRRQNFAEIAREYSIAPEAEEGGLLGPFARGEMPRVFDVAFSMRRGEIRGILKSTYGFHLIMLEEKIKAHEISFDDAKEKIREILIKQQQEGEYQKVVELALNTIDVRPPKRLW